MNRKIRYFLEDICALFIYPPFTKKHKYFLTICCIVKDENEYLAEWLWYHQKVGVEHFYIYDNNSKIPVSETLEKEIAAGTVTVIPIEGTGVQIQAYEQCLAIYGKDSRWMGFIDTDEFIVPKSTNWLPDLLKKYRRFGGLGVNWIIFGSGGNIEKPTDLQIKSFLKHSPREYYVNRHIKSIVQPRFTLRTKGDPHSFKFRFAKYCVNEKRKGISGAIVPHHSDLIQLNHYYTRSEQEFKAKIARGRGDGAGRRTMEDLYDTDAHCTEQSDTSILRIADLS